VYGVEAWRRVHAARVEKKRRSTPGGEGVLPFWYGPGTLLTDQTGEVSDTASGSSGVEHLDVLESEQCDGREAALCV